MKRVRSPQEKKSLSLEKDRRFNSGYSPHGLRKGLPKARAFGNRAVRRAGKVNSDDIVDGEERAEGRFVRKLATRWKKYPEATLAEKIVNQERRRIVSYRRKRDAQEDHALWVAATGGRGTYMRGSCVDHRQPEPVRYRRCRGPKV